MVAPAGTPADRISKVSQAIAETIRLPDVQKRLADMLAEPMGLNPADSLAFMRQDAERWKRVIANSQIQVD